MRQETIDKMLCWLNNAPESGHLYDKERLYDFIIALIKNENGYLDSCHFDKMVKRVKQERPECISNIEDFCEDNSILIENILGFVKYWKSNE